MSKESFQLNIGPLTAHAFSKDRLQVAVCPNTNEVLIYQRSSLSSSDWQVAHVLEGVWLVEDGRLWLILLCYYYDSNSA